MRTRWGRRRRPATSATLALLAAVVAGMLAGAALTGPAQAAVARREPTRAAARVTIVAAENFWGSIVKQLAGDHGSVTSIITNPATDPHSYEAKPSDTRPIAGARCVVVNGIGYGPWAQKGVDANPSSGRKVLVVGDSLGLKDGDNP